MSDFSRRLYPQLFKIYFNTMKVLSCPKCTILSQSNENFVDCKCVSIAGRFVKEILSGVFKEVESVWEF